ncbi:MlaD family protein [Hydrogenophaga sp.]|uniref:MlaD family protein n=1 Tax=Hydrogenophaga sp. TaxID=1904254 RepID=UPI00271C48A2|nr:MlaD family protein [Hydrogenophaga sp.]MDO9251865.1 MlaD family protein [Hydrogenophaga sp.]MDP2405923.1 MlaD family protein [Hydrogenophaga sp.]MDP3322625.1 MlaD family protein [Hydrogenophaga sp.]MDP3885972.1 MlaD family protein [Hydrogenophaga sp.]MDZ4177556.1 MlaD family protein [Hydrogenophaga sp.]
MDDKVNYTLVGGFVLVLGALLVAGVLWLAAGLGGRQAMDAYQAVIQESVAGLSIDAPVKYLGVDVGKVARIEIDPQNSEQVRLHFLVKRGTPIKRDSVAVLKAQGLTGIAYIELSGGSAGSPPLLAGADGEIPTIPTKPSLSARLENVLSNVLANVDRVSNNLNAVLGPDNQAALKSTLADIATLARTLAGQQAAISAGLADAAKAARLTARAGEQFEPTLARIASSAQAVERMAEVAGKASTRAGAAADAAATSAQQLGSETLPELARLMAELNQLSASLRQLSEQTTVNPNSLLLGKPAPQPGPGESLP